MFKKALILLIWVGLFLLGSLNLVFGQPPIGTQPPVKKPTPSRTSEGVSVPKKDIHIPAKHIRVISPKIKGVTHLTFPLL